MAKNNFFPLLNQIFCFGIVGIAAAIVHFSVVVLLVQSYNFLPLIANIFGFLTAFQLSYWGNRLWTFNNTQTMHRLALPKLLFVQILAFTVNESLFSVFLMLKFPYPLALGLVLVVLAFLRSLPANYGYSDDDSF